MMAPLPTRSKTRPLMRTRCSVCGFSMSLLPFIWQDAFFAKASAGGNSPARPLEINRPSLARSPGTRIRSCVKSWPPRSSKEAVSTLGSKCPCPLDPTAVPTPVPATGNALPPGHFHGEEVIEDRARGVVSVVALRAAYEEIELDRCGVHGTGRGSLVQKRIVHL